MVVIMAQKDWSDYFAAAYGGGGFSEGMKMGFEKWKTQKTLEQLKQVWGITPEGTLAPLGAVPKGSQVVTPPATQIDIAQEKAKIPTADMRNLIVQSKAQLQNIQALRKEADILPGGYEGMKVRATAILTRGKVGGNVYAYERKLPALAAGLYRALTGDNRLSDMDAQQRALPLLWNTSIDPSLKKPMFDYLEIAFKTREKMLKEGLYTVDKDTGQPVIDWQILSLETKKQKAKDAGYSDEEINNFLGIK